MEEKLLCKIWQNQLFNTHSLYTDKGDRLKILSAGTINIDEGPDFTDVKIEIDGQLLAGNIEVDVKSSNWYLHKHHEHSQYNSVVLHVVWEKDKEIYRKDKTDCLTLELKHYVDSDIFHKYHSLLKNKPPLLCKNSLDKVHSLTKKIFLSRTVTERLEEKSTSVYDMLDKTKNNWEQTFYILTARSFGLNVNAEPFEMLSWSLDQKLFARYKDQRIKIEALIFGQAGFLEDNTLVDPYFESLKKEYSYLRKAHNLTPMDVKNWKFLRMRPGNFPTIRLAQFASFVEKSNRLFSTILTKGSTQIASLFQHIEPNPYWDNHYKFGVESKKRKKNLGLSAIRSIIINSICVTLFAYGKAIDDKELVNKALYILECIEAESNRYTNLFSEANWEAENSLESQGQIHLFKNYCSKKKCLDCNIGFEIIKT